MNAFQTTVLATENPAYQLAADLLSRLAARGVFQPMRGVTAHMDSESRPIPSALASNYAGPWGPGFEMLVTVSIRRVLADRARTLP